MFFEKYTLKQKFILVFGLLIILFVIVSLFNMYRNTLGIKYKGLTGEKLVSQGVVNADRTIYWQMDMIVKKIYSYNEDELEDLYNIMQEDYKKNISKAQYVANLKEFRSKLSNNSLNGCIENVYVINSNVFVCKIKGVEGMYAYFGCVISNNNYSIFYIE